MIVKATSGTGKVCLRPSFSDVVGSCFFVCLFVLLLLLGKTMTKMYFSSAPLQARLAIFSTGLENKSARQHFSHTCTICRRPAMMTTVKRMTAIRKAQRNPRSRQMLSKSRTKWWKTGKRPYRRNRRLASSER